MSFLHLCTGILCHSSFSSYARSQIWRTPSPRCCFKMFYGIESWIHCCSLQTSPVLCLKPFLGPFWSLLWVILLPEDLMETRRSETRPCIMLQNSLVVFRFYDAMQAVEVPSARGSKAAPIYLNFHCVWRQGTFSFLWWPHYIFCKRYSHVLYQKGLFWSHLTTGCSPRRILSSSGNLASVLAVQSSFFSFRQRRIVQADTSVPFVQCVWKLIEVHFPPCTHFFNAVLHQFLFSVCIHF